MEYYKQEGLSGSRLGLLARSPAHYREAVDNPKEASEAMRFGSLVHSLLLEPGSNNYLVLPEGMRKDKRNKDYQALLSTGRPLVRAKDMEAAEEMVDAVTMDHAAALALADCSFEEAFFWQEAGVQCKGKLDFYNPEAYYIGDYKTCVDASPDRFRYKVLDMGYLLQLAHYQAAIKQSTGREDYPGVLVIAQEKDSPYVVQVYSVSQPLIDEAHEHRRRLLELYKECSTSGVWRGYSKEIVEL